MYQIDENCCTVKLIFSMHLSSWRKLYLNFVPFLFLVWYKNQLISFHLKSKLNQSLLLHGSHHSLSRVVVPTTLTQHLCQRSFYKIFVKFRNSKKHVLKIVLIIININKDENKSLISNQFSLKNDPPPPISWRTILRR